MPRYKKVTNTQIVSHRHAQTYLSRMDKDTWDSVFIPAVKAIKKNPTGPKIKQSSYEHILKHEFPIQLIHSLHRERELHLEPKNDYHEGGGLGGAVKVVANSLGMNLGPEGNHRDLTDEEKDYAQLVDATYQSERPESYEEWTRMPAYDTTYGSFWQNTVDNRAVLTVRGTEKTHLKDLWKDVKMFAGSNSVHDDALNDSVKRFVADFPNRKYDISSHSLGSELIMNGVEQQNFDPEEILLFSPGSSPFMSKEHLQKHIANPDVKLFLNKSDPLSSYYSQVLTDDDLSRVVFSDKTKNPLSAHNLSQWF